MRHVTRFSRLISPRAFFAAATACAALSTLTPGVARAQATTAAPATGTAPDYSTYKASYHLPFARTVDFKNLSGLRVRVSINGGPVQTFLVDTGSVGILVGADLVPNIDPNAPAGSMKYSSSGLEFDGVWTPVTLTFPDALDAQGHPMTAKLPILAVKERKATGTGVNSKGMTSSKNPHPYMFGIGFGRGAELHPERNPFLNIAEMVAGTMRRGYTITHDGFTLGLTAPAVGAGYKFTKLTERPVSADAAAMRPGLKDWATAPGSVTVGSVASPMGSVLIDTGLTNMMIGIPGQASGAEIPAGTPITMHLLNGQFDYTFNTGDATNPLTPRRVTWIKASGTPFINTGLRTLAAFDYLYDADGGWLGLRPVK